MVQDISHCTPMTMILRNRPASASNTQENLVVVHAKLCGKQVNVSGTHTRYVTLMQQYHDWRCPLYNICRQHRTRCLSVRTLPTDHIYSRVVLLKPSQRPVRLEHCHVAQEVLYSTVTLNTVLLPWNNTPGWDVWTVLISLVHSYEHNSWE